MFNLDLNEADVQTLQKKLTENIRMAPLHIGLLDSFKKMKLYHTPAFHKISCIKNTQTQNACKCKSMGMNIKLAYLLF